MNCLDFSWHDGILQKIIVDRNNPGEMDTLELLVVQDEQRWKVTFIEVYAVHLRMNFGVIGDESIYSFKVLETSDEISEIKERWKVIGGDLANLRGYQIITAATNSTIEIYSIRECIIEPVWKG
jgi:hypothetical protein